LFVYVMEVLLLIMVGIIIGFLSGFLFFLSYYQSFLPRVSYLSYIMQLAFRSLDLENFLMFYVLLSCYALVTLLYPYTKIMLIYHTKNRRKHKTGEKFHATF
nr:hypothetical protein [Candidatus Sigynarchaeota archaeon]